MLLIGLVETYNGGSEEIITSEEHGLLSEPADSKELAETILIALDKVWDSEKILKYAEKFRWKNIAKDVL
jgi:glycosyltransferase involved in cell wall biosynthesis